MKKNQHFFFLFLFFRIYSFLLIFMRLLCWYDDDEKRTNFFSYFLIFIVGSLICIVAFLFWLQIYSCSSIYITIYIYIFYHKYLKIFRILKYFTDEKRKLLNSIIVKHQIRIISIRRNRKKIIKYKAFLVILRNKFELNKVSQFEFLTLRIEYLIFERS